MRYNRRYLFTEKEVIRLSENFLKGYRKLIIGGITLIAGILCQLLTLDNPAVWKDVSGLMTPAGLIYIGLGIAVGGNFIDKIKP